MPTALPNYSGALIVQIEETIRRYLNVLGLDIRRTKNVPTFTMLGLPLRPVRTIVDVGANRGQFARKVLPLFPAAALYSFEPLPSACRELRKLADTHPNMHVRQLALGDRPGAAIFHEHVDHTPSSSLLSATPESRRLFPQTSRQQETEVEISTLDEQFPKPEDLIRQVLLKLDVQGYEDRVLRGGRKLLNYVDIVITEYSVVSLYEGQATFLEISEELASAGLTYAGNLDQIYDEHGTVLFLDAVFIRNGR